MHAPFRAKIVGDGTPQTLHVVTQGRTIKQIVITCSTAGQTLKIQEPSSGLILIAVFSPTVSTTGSPIIINFDAPIYMNGIDIVTTATGTISIWISYAEDKQ